MKHINITIEGKVQGVWFRDSTRKEANRIGLNGIVRNESDGSVYVEVEGSTDKLEEFEKWCHIGSDQSEVSSVTVVEGQVVDFTSFEITDWL